MFRPYRLFKFLFLVKIQIERKQLRQAGPFRTLFIWGGGVNLP